MKEKKKNKKLNKKFLKLLIIYVCSFLALYVVLGISVYTVFKAKTLGDAERDLKSVERINSGRVVSGPGGVDIYAQINNPRVNVIFYDESKNVIENGYSKELVGLLTNTNRFGHNDYTDSEINEALSSSLFKCNNNLGVINKFERVNNNSGNELVFMTYSFSVNSKTAPEIKYCKAIIMVNTNLNDLNNLMTIYLFVSLALFVLVLGVSLLLTYLAIKPIRETIEKEKDFISDASHELKTPLSIVQSKIENILTQSDSKVIDVSSDLVVSLNQISRLNKLTSDLLTLSRSDNNKDLLVLEKVNIKDILFDTVSIFKEVAIMNEKTFDMSFEDIEATVDKDKINQLVVILLDNANKYTNSNDNISFKAYQKGNDFCIEVSDTGVGISNEGKKKIFDRFYREDKARSRETGGNGLGLSIAKEIVLSHKGSIKVEDNDNKGTKFIVLIPKSK